MFDFDGSVFLPVFDPCIVLSYLSRVPLATQVSRPCSLLRSSFLPFFSLSSLFFIHVNKSCVRYVFSKGETRINTYTIARPVGVRITRAPSL